MIRKRYGVPTAFGLPGRVTYVIDRQGIVRLIFFSQFTAEKHVAQALHTKLRSVWYNRGNNGGREENLLWERESHEPLLIFPWKKSNVA
jgi:hypothetical protein